MADPTAPGPQGPAPAPTPTDSGGELSIRQAVDQLAAERKREAGQQPPTPAPQPQQPPPQRFRSDGPDASDLATLQQIEPDEPAQQYEPPPRYRLPDGTEATAEEVAEWRRGNLRQQDYTRKTQELAQHRNALAQHAQKYQQDLATFHGNQAAVMQAIDNTIAVAQHYLPQPPTDELRKSDFYTWQEQKAEYDARVNQIQGLHQHRQYVAAVEQAKQQEAHRNHLSWQQRALYTVRPELRDPARAAKYSQDFKAWAVRKGFSPQEATSVQDTRLLLALEGSMKWDKLQEQKAKLSEKAKDAQPMQPQTPGRRYSAAERENQSVASLRKTFEDKAETGSMASIRDAARLLAAERHAAARRR